MGKLDLLGGETYVMWNTQESKFHYLLSSLYFSPRLQERSLQLALIFCFWGSPWFSVTRCHFLLYVLDLLVGKAPPVFTMVSLETPENGANEMFASCFTVYKGLASKIFHITLTIDLPFTLYAKCSVQCLASGGTLRKWWLLGRHFHPLYRWGTQRG